MKRLLSTTRFQVLIILAIPAYALANPIISWIDPPEEIEIPAPQQRNIFLKVKVTETRPEEVYLAPANAHARSERVSLSQTGEEEYTLNLSDPQVVAFARNANLSKGLCAYAQFGGGKTISSVVVRVKFSPNYKPIILKCDPIRVVQRGHVKLPGSHGQLQLYISDISNGMTVATIMSNDGDTYFGGMPMRAGESETFEIREGEKYTIACETLHNALIGADYGIFRVCKTEDWNSYQIARLVQFIDESDALFVAGNEKKAGPEFAKLLKAKINDSKNDPLNFSKFLKVASMALNAKTPCEVHTKDGTTVELYQWYETTWKTKESNNATSRPSK